MCEQDIALRCARDQERWRRRAAGRRARGLCVKCGKRPPAPHGCQCEPCAEKRRSADRARHHRRTAARVTAGLCPRCGKHEPAPGRTLCESCADKRNRAGRARDARLRAEGKPRQNRERARAHERERSRRERAARRADGICTACGKAPASPNHASCEPCLEKRRNSDRARYAAGKAAGLPYGGANPEVKRRAGRARSRRRQQARVEAGQCIRCGRHPPVEGGTTCRPCRDKRQAAERRKYEERRAARLCTRCGVPTIDGLSRCAPCAVVEEASRNPERKNARSRELYAERRARNLCTSCGAPSQGASRCASCAERSYHGSAHFRGMPLHPSSFAVFLRDGEECLGTFDDEMEVAAFLAFEKIDRDRVEIVADRPWLASLAAWE